MTKKHFLQKNYPDKEFILFRHASMLIGMKTYLTTRMRMKTKKPTDDFKDYILDQLAGLPDLVCRSMFGAYGLYQGEYFFAILHAGRLYFKTNEQTRSDYEARQMEPFRPNEKQTLKNYFEVPVDVLEDGDMLRAWAEKAIKVSQVKKPSPHRGVSR